MGRFSTNFRSNFKKGFSGNALIGDAIGASTAVLYGVIPTLLNLNGPMALAVGAGVPYLLGKALDVPEWCNAAAALATYHVMQNNQDTVAKVLGKPLWRLDNGVAGLADVQPGATVDSFNGVPVVSYPGQPGQLETADTMMGLADRNITVAELQAGNVPQYTGNPNSIYNRGGARAYMRN